MNIISYLIVSIASYAIWHWTITDYPSLESTVAVVRGLREVAGGLRFETELELAKCYDVAMDWVLDMEAGRVISPDDAATLVAAFKSARKSMIRVISHEKHLFVLVQETVRPMIAYYERQNYLTSRILEGEYIIPLHAISQNIARISSEIDIAKSVINDAGTLLYRLRLQYPAAIEDVEKSRPGTLAWIFQWFNEYKTKLSAIENRLALLDRADHLQQEMERFLRHQEDLLIKADLFNEYIANHVTQSKTIMLAASPLIPQLLTDLRAIEQMPLLTAQYLGIDSHF